jgi:hypothetical protein
MSNGLNQRSSIDENQTTIKEVKCTLKFLEPVMLVRLVKSDYAAS